MFLVTDDYGDYVDILDYLGAKDMLIDEIVEEIKEHGEDYEILEPSVKQLGELAKGDVHVSVHYLKDNLQSFGWHIVDLQDFERDINNLKIFFEKKKADTKAFDEILDLLDKEVR